MGAEVVLITGCSRGIGLGLVDYFAKAGYKVVATCRSPDKSPDLAKLLDSHGQPPALALDTTNPASLLKAVNTVMTRHGKLDILLNNAGVATRNHPNDPPEHLDVAEMTNVFATNVGGTCAATQAFLPLLRKSSLPRVLCISSFLGSISRNLPSESNFYMATSYRCSKSALNQLIKCFSLDIPEVVFLSVSPGHVQTDMGNASGRTAPLTVDHVAERITKLASNATKTMSGQFLDFDGELIPY